MKIIIKAPVFVTISNGLYRSLYTGFVLKVSSLKNIEFVPDSSSSTKGSNRTFNIRYDSLGVPSCAKVWYVVGINTSEIVTYGSKDSCQAFYPSLKYVGDYKINGSHLSFEMTLNFNGLAYINFQIRNSIETVTLKTNVTISSFACERPKLDIENRAADFLSPVSFVRSKMFSLVGITTLNCDSSLQNTKQWLVYDIDPSKGTLKSTKPRDFGNNPSVYNAEMFIPSNYLPYGTYKFVYRVNMFGDGAPFIDEVDTYVKIVPAGIVIFPFSGGMKHRTIGVGQSIDLDPGKYSYDLDGIASGTDLTYRYYCRVLIDGLPQQFPSDSYDSFLDLQKIQDGNVAVNMSTENTCFNTTSIKN